MKGGALRADFACRPCGSRIVTSACRSIALCPFPVNYCYNKRGNFRKNKLIATLNFLRSSVLICSLYPNRPKANASVTKLFSLVFCFYLKNSLRGLLPLAWVAVQRLSNYYFEILPFALLFKFCCRTKISLEK